MELISLSVIGALSFASWYFLIRKNQEKNDLLDGTYNNFQYLSPHLLAYRQQKSSVDSLIKELPTLKNNSIYIPDRGIKSNEINCFICKQSLFNYLRSLSCGHMFHRTCLRKWLLDNDDCPFGCDHL